MTRSIKQKMFKKSNKCFYCGDEFEFKCLSVDHKVPKKNKGKTDNSNLVLACYKCNKLKGSVFDPVHFKEIIIDGLYRDHYWSVRRQLKRKLLKKEKGSLLQIWSYRKQIEDNKLKIIAFKKANLSIDSLVNVNNNNQVQIKKILKKLHLLIEEETKKTIKAKLKLNKEIDIINVNKL